MAKIAQEILAAFLLAALAGCSSSPVVLKPEGGGPAGVGEVEQSFVQPYRVTVTVGDEIYVGQWKAQDAPDHPLAHSYLHKHRVGRVLTTLTSAQGHRMNCNWLVESMSGYGTCEDESHRKFDAVIGHG